MKKGSIGLIIVGVIVVIAILLATSYNSLVRADESVNQAWSQVEVNYQRRADLIPNLVETVKGYAKHESDVLEKISALRAGYQGAKSPEELQKLDSDLKTAINVAVEAYPELKANENFLSLQDELAGTENRIAVARKDYNEAATSYNKMVRVFPRNLIAGIFGFEKRELFAAAPGSETAPSVNFGS